MPPCNLDARRLVLVKAPSAASDGAAVCQHIVEQHGDDVRYMMSVGTDEGIHLLDMLVADIQPKTLGMLATSQSAALQGIAADESLEDAEYRALETRDYVLRGTLDGGTSVMILHESIMELLLLRAVDRESSVDLLPRDQDDVPDCGVLDFGLGTYPWMVADELPLVQPQFRIPS